jgi:hypothetical protein
MADARAAAEHALEVETAEEARRVAAALL